MTFVITAIIGLVFAYIGIALDVPQVISFWCGAMGLGIIIVIWRLSE